MLAAFVDNSEDAVREAVLPHMANILAITPTGSGGPFVSSISSSLDMLPSYGWGIS